MTSEFNDKSCVGNLCRLLGAEFHEFPAALCNGKRFPEKAGYGGAGTLRRKMIKKILRKRKFEGAGFLGKYWLVIFDATGLFHFQDRHCPHCLKKVMDKR